MFTSSSIKLQGQRQRALSLATLSLSYFMVLLDSTILNVALPALEKNLHGSVAGLQWVVNSYTLIFASFLLSGGTLGDRLTFYHKFGVKR